MSSGVRFSLDSLPERYRVQAIRQLSGGNAVNALTERPDSNGCAAKGKNPEQKSVHPKAVVKKVRGPIMMRKASGGMSSAEAQFNRDVLLGLGKYEPITFTLQGGVRYTPDFLFKDPNTGSIYFFEVKGNYRLPTHGRSVMAFKACCAAFPEFTFCFAELGKDGKTWKVGVYNDGNVISVVEGTAKELHEMK